MTERDDQEGLSDLYPRWKRALVAFFHRRVPDASEAEDLAHDTIMRVMANDRGKQLNDGYMFRVAQNMLIDRSRRQIVRGRHGQSEQVIGQDLYAIDPERILEGREDVATFVAVLDTFPERTRSIFLLYRLENMSQADIGETFGITASAVKQQVAKVMVALAKAMRESK